MTNLKCLTDQELTLYSSGALDPDDMRTAAEHISSCSDCARILTGIRKTLAAVPRQPLHLTDAEKRQFTDRVMRKVNAGRHRGRLQAWATVTTAVAAGLLAVILFSPANKPLSINPDQTVQFAEFDLVENMEMLEMMDLLEMMELLELMDDKG